MVGTKSKRGHTRDVPAQKALAKAFTWKMGGQAGTGIKNSALILAKAFIKGGYYVHANVEYPSIVRGGNNTLEVRMSTRPVRALDGRVNLLAALDGRTVAMWSHELVDGGALLFDQANSDLGKTEAELKKRGIELFDVPLRKILAEHNLPPIMLNTVMLGCIVAVVCYDLKLLQKGLEEVYRKKGKEVVEANKRAADAGYDYMRAYHKERFVCQAKIKPAERILLEGNEGVMLGAIKAGMTSYTGYPMTPTSSLLHFGAQLKKSFNVFTYQPEDEIASIQFAIGASYAGARAMTGTSGGGFSLMAESLGLAAMTETPLVVLLGQRPGPATGLPTRTGQGDLRFALHAAQDEPPRVVLAPGDPEEAFELVFHAFNIAEKYQLLVIVLGDKYLQEGFWTHEPLKLAGLTIERGKILSAQQAARLTSYNRFAITADGVSPVIHPGTPGLKSIWRVSADEHDQAGFITEDRANRIAMVEKRRRKVETAYQGTIKRIDPIRVYGKKSATRAVISFGSNKGVLLDALDELGTGANIKVIMVRCLSPFPIKEMQAALRGVKEILTIEGNDTGLLEGLIREKTGHATKRHLRFFDGRPLTIPQVLTFLQKK
jgi:2-oxoglutarate ferredoxin oxidoreductase subunit alpha